MLLLPNEVVRNNPLCLAKKACLRSAGATSWRKKYHKMKCLSRKTLHRSSTAHFEIGLTIPGGRSESCVRSSEYISSLDIENYLGTQAYKFAEKICLMFYYAAKDHQDVDHPISNHWTFGSCSVPTILRKSSRVTEGCRTSTGH